jgi:hypothetical protein
MTHNPNKSNNDIDHDNAFKHYTVFPWYQRWSAIEIKSRFNIQVNIKQN